MHQKTRLVVLPDALRRVASSGEPRPLFGVWRPTERLIQILGDALEEAPPIRHLGRAEPASTGDAGVGHLVLGDAAFALNLDADLPTPDEYELLDGWEALDTRRGDLVPSSGLGSRTVFLAGAGSLGSAIGLLLAQAGVGTFVVADNDDLSTANVSRHACDLTDLGRSKVEAVAELLRHRGSRARAVRIDLAAEAEEALGDLVRLADLTVATTDSPAAQFTLNEAVVVAGGRAVFAAAYERACGGEVVARVPDAGPCLFCAVGFRAGLTEALQPHERRRAYQSADAHRLEAEPGLALDIGFIASVAAAHCLALLDPEGSRGDLVGGDGAFTLVHGPSRPKGPYADLFRSPLDLVRVRVSTDGPCPVCGYDSRGGVA